MFISGYANIKVVTSQQISQSYFIKEIQNGRRSCVYITRCKHE